MAGHSVQSTARHQCGVIGPDLKEKGGIAVSKFHEWYTNNS